jgi:hypothetical protein
LCTAQIFGAIVTAHETWLHHYEPKRKAQSMTWKRLTSPVAKKFKSQPSAGKIMRTLFWGYGRCDCWFISLQRVKPLNQISVSSAIWKKI